MRSRRLGTPALPTVRETTSDRSRLALRDDYEGSGLFRALGLSGLVRFRACCGLSERVQGTTRRRSDTALAMFRDGRAAVSRQN
jgi:hypothetical protein